MRRGRVATTLTAACVAALAADASAATLQPLKRCYVSASAEQRETMFVAGAGFTPGSTVDITVAGRRAGTATADAAGVLAEQRVRAPHQRRGVREFGVRVTERGNPENTVAARTRVAALTTTLSPRPQLPAQRVRWRGLGFTLAKKVFVHYVLRGRSRRTVALTRPKGACGAFRTRAAQFPFRPGVGRWRIQVDQQRRYSERPASAFTYFVVRVRRAG